ncbi:MAG: hypothetical protein ACOYN0_05910 [Phycisphaerales bacterium]
MNRKLYPHFLQYPQGLLSTMSVASANHDPAATSQRGTDAYHRLVVQGVPGETTSPA